MKRIAASLLTCALACGGSPSLPVPNAGGTAKVLAKGDGARTMVGDLAIDAQHICLYGGTLQCVQSAALAPLAGQETR